MGGRGIVAVATFFVPVGLIASAVMTVSNVNSAADQLVDDKDRGDLFQLNKKALLDLGFSQEKVIQFLNHPYYTPREVTYLRFYLEKLKRVSGFEVILDAAMAAPATVGRVLFDTYWLAVEAVSIMLFAALAAALLLGRGRSGGRAQPTGGPAA